MARKVLPFLGTHVANIALNRQIGLIFLFSRPQETHGLTEVSHESFLNDQLQVAQWMILNFLEPHEHEHAPTPWVEVPEWRVQMMEMPDPAESARFEETLGQIHAEAQALAGELWNRENETARAFLLRLAVQISECVRFTNRRVTAIKVCGRLGGLGENPDQVEFEEELLTAGPTLAQELMETFGFAGRNGIGPMGYLAIKNSTPALRIFAMKLLELVRRLLVDEAVKRGYARPTSDENAE